MIEMADFVHVLDLLLTVGCLHLSDGESGVADGADGKGGASGGSGDGVVVISIGMLQ